jgi:DNA-binding MarR family transcriptional regulator
MWLNDREQAAWRVYLSSHARLVAELNRRLVAVSGLTVNDYEVLVNLSEASGGRVRSFELAEAMQWERSRLTHQLTRMEGRDLIRREVCEDDRRGSFVVITPAGRRILRRAAPHHAADVRELFVLPAGSQLSAVAAVAGRMSSALSKVE